MSKKLDCQFTCPKCGTKKITQIYRSLWIEDSKNFQNLLDGKINSIECDSCHTITNVNQPLLVTNVKKEIAVWFEPFHDDAIDSDTAGYTAMFGKDSFYAKAPRIKVWDEFVNLVKKLNTSKPDTTFRERNLIIPSLIDVRKIVGKFKDNNNEDHPRQATEKYFIFRRLMISLFWLNFVICLFSAFWFHYESNSEFKRWKGMSDFIGENKDQCKTNTFITCEVLEDYYKENEKRIDLVHQYKGSARILYSLSIIFPFLIYFFWNLYNWIIFGARYPMFVFSKKD